jgi:hypothetical protein
MTRRAASSRLLYYATLAALVAFAAGIAIGSGLTAGPVAPPSVRGLVLHEERDGSWSQHEHTCHVEQVYIDETVAYPPTVWEANCDGARIRLYAD